MKKFATLVLAFLALSAVSAAAQVIDGVAEPAYGPPLSIQTTQTQFGDANIGQMMYANGSELDAGYAYVSGGTLYLVLAGNLESNYNKLEIFFDTGVGGQNKLRGDNAGVDFNGLNRMGDDGSGNGLRFDAGFAADYWIDVTGGDGPPYALYANWAQLLTGGGGPGDYLGTNPGGPSGGVLAGGTDHGIRITIDNTNAAGVGGGCGPDGAGAGVTTGVELAIPLAAIGNPSGCISICAFVNGGGHDYLSNQVLGPLPPGTCNLGEPRNVDFSQFAGNQYFSLGNCSTPVQPQTWGHLKASYR